MRRNILGIFMLLFATTAVGCVEYRTEWPPRPGSVQLPTGPNGEMWLFCRSGSTYDAFCAGFGEDPCPEGWTQVPFRSLPETCCMDAAGNAFWTDEAQCAAGWTTIRDGCLGHQPPCN